MRADARAGGRTVIALATIVAAGILGVVGLVMATSAAPHDGHPHGTAAILRMVGELSGGAIVAGAAVCLLFGIAVLLNDGAATARCALLGAATVALGTAVAVGGVALLLDGASGRRLSRAGLLVAGIVVALCGIGVLLAGLTALLMTVMLTVAEAAGATARLAVHGSAAPRRPASGRIPPSEATTRPATQWR